MNRRSFLKSLPVTPLAAKAVASGVVTLPRASGPAYISREALRAKLLEEYRQDMIRAFMFGIDKSISSDGMKSYLVAA